MKHTSLQVTPEFGCVCVRASLAPSVLVSGKWGRQSCSVGLPGSDSGSGFKALLRAVSVGKCE